MIGLYLGALIAGCSADSQATDTGKDPADSGASDSDSGAFDSETGAATEVAVTGVTWTLDDDIQSIGVVTWEQTAEAVEVWVEFQVDGEEWQSSPHQPGPVGPQSAMVVGVPYGSTVHYRVANDFGAGGVVGETYDAAVGALPEGLGLPTASTPLPDSVDPNLRFLLLALSTPEEAGWKVALDRQGRVVWAHPSTGGTGQMQASADGTHILWDEGDDNPIVYRMAIDGTITESVDLPGLHHSFTEAGDGALLWGGKDAGREVVRERAADGTVRQLFECSSFWEEHDATIDCDGNAVFWSPADDHVLFSSDNENTVVRIDRSSSQVVAWYGQLDGAYAFADGAAYFWKQHSSIITAEGHLLLSSWVAPENHVQVVREYEIDDTSREIRELWVCDPQSTVEANHSGETARLDGGNTLLNSGPGATIREYTPACELAWELTWSEGTSLRRMTPVADLYAFAP